MSGDTPRTEAVGPHRLQGLPRRPRGTSAAPTTAVDAAGAPGTHDDSDDTLSPESLARAMVAIRRGSDRARLAGPDDSDGADGRPAPRPGPDAA
jgi:hypothetical protein